MVFAYFLFYHVCIYGLRELGFFDFLVLRDASFYLAFDEGLEFGFIHVEEDSHVFGIDLADCFEACGEHCSDLFVEERIFGLIDQLPKIIQEFCIVGFIKSNDEFT